MNRIHNRLLFTPVAAILLFLVFSSTVYAQINYSVTATLSLVSGPDPLLLDQTTFTGTATLLQTMTPTSSMTTSTSSTNTYSGVGAGIQLGNLQCENTANLTVTLTDNAGAPDTIDLGNCRIQYTTVSANVIIPAGAMITAVPAAIPLTNVSGTVSYSLGVDGATVFNLTEAVILAVDNNPPSGSPPTITPSPASWNPIVSVGSTTPLTQQINFTTSYPAAAVSFTTSAATSDGGTWLSVTPAAINSSSAITISVNPSGLTQPAYSGTVTLSFGSSDMPPVLIPVTLTISNGTVSTTSLTGPSSMTFAYTVGGSTPPYQTLTIGSSPSSGTPVNATVTSGNSWLSVTPASGTTPANFTVSINTSTTGLTTSQTLTGNIQIASSNVTNSPFNVPVTLTVSASSSSPSSSLTVPTTPLTFNYTIGGNAPAAQAVNVSGPSGTSFTTSTGGAAWLSATSGGTTPATVSISVNTTGLAAATYTGAVTVTAAGVSGSPATIPVTLIVASASTSNGTLTASPSSLNFSYSIGNPAPATQSITVGGTSGSSFTATASGGTWLSVSPSSGITPGFVSVSVNPSGLTAATYNGTVTIAASGATSQVVNVSLVVSSAPSISLSPSSLSFAYQTGGSAPAAQSVSIAGSSGLAFTATASGGSWLSVNPRSGATSSSSSVTVSVDPSNLAAGTYNGTVTIAAAGAASEAVNVTLVVSTSSQTITVTPSSLNFTAAVGAAAPPSQTVNVTGGGSSSMSVTTSGGSWLSASLSASTTSAVVTVSVNPANLTAGTYTGTVAITLPGATNSPQNVAVTFVVSGTAILAATPANLNFAYLPGNPNPSAQIVNITSSQPASFSIATANGSWLTVTSSGTTTPASLTANVNPAGLSDGSYQATITISSANATNSPLVISVGLVVSNEPTIVASPSSLTFTAAGTNPPSQSISLNGNSTLPFSVTASPSWIALSAASGVTPSTLVATVNSSGMSQGSYQGTITVTSAVAGTPLVIPVTLNVTAAQASTVPTISAVVNAASYEATGFSPGALVSIFGSFLGPQTGASFTVTSQGSLAPTVGGTSVMVSGVPAIPLFAQNGQVNVILPFSLGTAGQATVVVTYDNVPSAPFTIPLAPSDVQIFTANASGSGPGSILNQDYSINTAANPAAPGSIVSVYGTGGGAVGPAVTAGYVAGDTLSWISLPYSATVNGQSATVQYAGTAPTLVYGVDQFNVLLPANLPPGPANIMLKVGNSNSQADVTVFVK
jgi:uncharacterized protein (TIGR03437 family)